MRPEDNLREDHGQIMKLFVAWQHKLEKLDHKDKALLEDFEKCIDWVEVFIDRCHHGKEDEILFPAMASSEDPKVTSLIEDLHSEHQTGRALLESIKLAFKTLSQPDGLPDGLTQLSRDYIDLFRKHIRRENAQLLPLIEKCIPIDVQQQIVAEFGRYEQSTIGPQKPISA
jgi:hemerythrin-like domain-containing protein